jgi:hypothetical protein
VWRYGESVSLTFREEDATLDRITEMVREQATHGNHPLDDEVVLVDGHGDLLTGDAVNGKHVAQLIV